MVSQGLLAGQSDRAFWIPPRPSIAREKGEPSCTFCAGAQPPLGAPASTEGGAPLVPRGHYRRLPERSFLRDGNTALKLLRCGLSQGRPVTLRSSPGAGQGNGSGAARSGAPRGRERSRLLHGAATGAISTLPCRLRPPSRGSQSAPSARNSNRLPSPGCTRATNGEARRSPATPAGARAANQDRGGAIKGGGGDSGAQMGAGVAWVWGRRLHHKQCAGAWGSTIQILLFCDFKVLYLGSFTFFFKVIYLLF